jgi:alkanesulfonate monooxygenase SsuD/methylene tetrahydromethanopterin reductase-like flavin-dependent oxidoreductase (luciferase family)
MKLGLAITSQHLPGEPLDRKLAETIEQVRLAREVGFDLIAVPQHFLTTEFQMLQPSVMAARLAAETGTMRLAVTIYLLPLLNPVLVAEETASLDVITGGRFILGVGLGYRQVEDRAFGVEAGERARRMAEHLDVITRLWAGEPATLDRPYCRLEGVSTGVRPLQRPRPPIWIAANNDVAVERAAILGDAWVINPHATLATIQRQMALYHAALDRAGKPFPAELPLLREIVVAESRASAIETARPYLERKYQAYVSWGQHKALPGDDDMTVAFDELVRDRFVLGEPGECAAELARAAAITGATTIILRAHWAGMPQETVMRAIRLIGEKIKPKLP